MAVTSTRQQFAQGAAIKIRVLLRLLKSLRGVGGARKRYVSHLGAGVLGM